MKIPKEQMRLRQAKQNAAWFKIPWRKLKKLKSLLKPKGTERFNGRRMKRLRDFELWQKDEAVPGWKG